MPSILDAAVLVGRESTYGTAATLTRAYEAQEDSFKRSLEHMESVGMRGGYQTTRQDRRDPTNLGGEGTIRVDFLTVGMGQLLQACFGTSTESVVTGSAYSQVHVTDSDEPGDSYTVQVQRVDVGGTQRDFTYLGSTVYGWSLKQSVREYLNYEWMFDAQDTSTATGAGTPAYPAGVPFHWEQLSATWDSNPINLTDLALDGDLGLKRDRFTMGGGALKQQAIRASLPEFTGTIQAEFENMTTYDAFTAGTVAELELVWDSGIEIETGENYTLTINMPAVQFSGDTPSVNLGDVPTQPSPFKVLHPTSGDAITVTYQTTTDTEIV